MSKENDFYKYALCNLIEEETYKNNKKHGSITYKISVTHITKFTENEIKLIIDNEVNVNKALLSFTVDSYSLFKDSLTILLDDSFIYGYSLKITINDLLIEIKPC